MSAARLSIRDVDELFEALRSPSISVRLAVLRAIAAAPDFARNLGTLQGWDVIDELVHQANQSCSVPYYRALVQALAPYRDPRVVSLFVKVYLMTSDESIRTLVETRLRTDPDLSPSVLITLDWSPSPPETPPADAGSGESENGQTRSPPSPDGSD